MTEGMLQGKFALVTGAGSPIGLGRAMTIALVKAGARVAMPTATANGSSAASRKLSRARRRSLRRAHCGRHHRPRAAEQACRASSPASGRFTSW
jgi:NAD(P)-dependent dehydrogenase (short-subunit alcohol dehydrogenase family)